MEAKEIKSLLKEARDAIREKEYKTALKHCKTVLKTDKNNYTAWVFIGAAAQEMGQLDQSAAAFRKGIELSPDQILSWQGLCALYEKTSENNEFQKDLPNVYLKLVELLSSDVKKQMEVTEKLGSLYLARNDKANYVSSMKICTGLIKDTKESYKLQLKLIDFLNSQEQLDGEHKELLIECYQNVIFSDSDDKPLDQNEELCREYFKFLVKSGLQDILNEDAKKFSQKFPESYVPLETICRMYFDNNIISDVPQYNEFMDNAVDKLIEKQPASCTGWMTKGLNLYSQLQYCSAVDTLTKGLDASAFSSEGYLLLSMCYLKLHEYKEAETHAIKGLHVGEKSSDVIKGKLMFSLAQALKGQFNYKEALEVLHKAEERLGRNVHLARFCYGIYIDINEIEEAKSILNELKEMNCDNRLLLEAEGLLCLKEKEYTTAEIKFLEKLDLEESAETLNLLAVAQFKNKKFKEAMNNFLKAARLDPHDYSNFLYLGKHYHQFLGDLSKAKQCYQKAYQLNMHCEEAGSLLSDTLGDLKEDENNKMFLLAVTSQLPLIKAKWAWLKLGLLQLKQNLYAEAVQSLQNAVRANSNDSHCWECLGEAYLQKGSLGAALLSFTKCLENNPDSFFPLYQIACIKKNQEKYSEAADGFKEALKLQPDYILALKGLAETNLLLARQNFIQCLFGVALDSCQEAINALSRAIKVRSDLVCLWKLLGEACVLPAVFNVQDVNIQIPDSLLMLETKEVEAHRESLLELAERFYIKGLSLKPKLPSLWHDLGTVYFYKSQNNKSMLMEKALSCFKTAVNFMPTNFVYWNSLGVAAASDELKNYALAQHAFIKSVTEENNNPIAWTNLGILYLVNQNIELAHNAFKTAQSLDPSYPISWIGQALIAEKVEHHDTMDLFRHCCFLGNHPEALQGYGRWVCSVLQDTSNRNTPLFKFSIQEMFAIPKASDGLTKLTANNKLVPSSFNMLGLLLERLGLLKSAAEAFKNAIGILEKQGRKKELQDAYSNYARILCNQEDYANAISYCLKLDNCSVDELCLLALAYYRNGQLEESLKGFGEALLQAEERDKSDILVAIAIVTKKLQGIKAAKQVLSSCTKISLPSLHGLVALCAAGLLSSDIETSQDALKALLPHERDPCFERKIACLASSQFLVLNQLKEARNSICKAVHKHPDSAALWCHLSELLVNDPDSITMATRCTTMATRHHVEDSHTLGLLVFCHLLEGKIEKSLQSAQKLAFLYPGHLSSWALLGTVLSSCHKLRRRLKKMFDYDRISKLGGSSDWKDFALLVQIQYAFNTQDWIKGKEHIDLLLWGYSGSEDKKELFEILSLVCEFMLSVNNGKFNSAKYAELESVINEKAKHPFEYLLLAKVELHLKKFEAAEKSLRRAIEIESEKKLPKRSIVPFMQLVKFSFENVKNESNEKEKYLNIMFEALSGVLKINPWCQMAHLFLAIWAIESKKEGLTRKSLERVLKLRNPGNAWPESLARRLLLHIYLGKNDDKKIQNIFEDAIQAQDSSFLELHRKMCSAVESNSGSKK